jgi:hypothetical protein
LVGLRTGRSASHRHSFSAFAGKANESRSAMFPAEGEANSRRS